MVNIRRMMFKTIHSITRHGSKRMRKSYPRSQNRRLQRRMTIVRRSACSAVENHNWNNLASVIFQCVQELTNRYRKMIHSTRRISELILHSDRINKRRIKCICYFSNRKLGIQYAEPSLQAVINCAFRLIKQHTVRYVKKLNLAQGLCPTFYVATRDTWPIH